MVDKAGTREAIFGPEDPLEEPVVGPWRAPGGSASGQRTEPPPLPTDDLIGRVGSWGSLDPGRRR